jgi:hypothetical protein
MLLSLYNLYIQAAIIYISLIIQIIPLAGFITISYAGIESRPDWQCIVENFSQ